MASRRGATVTASLLIVLLAVVAVAVIENSSRKTESVAAFLEERATPAQSPLPACHAQCDPIDQRYLTDLPFGSISFWMQPWRAYLDTWPASRLVDALGINFNVNAKEAPDVARLLHEVGFKLARIEINWSALSYEDPTRFTDESDIRTRLLALKDNGLRPLILLDANSQAPCPSKKVTLNVVAPASAGANTIMLSSASAAEVISGKTGLNAATFRAAAGLRKKRKHKHVKTPLTPEQRRVRRQERRAKAKAGLTQLVLQGNPGVLITHVSSTGAATLSRPLVNGLAAGSYKGTTLLYAPFGPPKLPDGSANPIFAATMKGWLSYVSTVSKLARSVFGPGGYDLEIWNELSFGSQFLNVENYYPQPSAGSPESKAGMGSEESTSTEGATVSESGEESAGEGAAKATKHKPKRRRGKITKAITKALLDETVAYLRNPANGISREVGISNGFASQTPFASGALAPPGLTALSKHPYATAKMFPAEYHIGPGSIPRDALGQRDTAGPARSPGRLTPLFVPRYQSLLPEYALTATSTETLMRDLAPFATEIDKTPHGRNVGRPGHRPPQLWVTEYNLSAGKASVMGPDGTTPQTGASAQLTPADKTHLEAKALLRSLVSMVSTGVTREYFYAAANAGPLSVIGEGFMSAVAAHPTEYRGTRLGGETMSGLHNMLTHFEEVGTSGSGAGAGATSQALAPRQLQLRAIAQDGEHAQFAGDGSVAHPSLYDREVLAVFPFQTSPTRFVIPFYVMSRDMLTLYEPGQPTSDIHRFDLPDETFRITVSNLPTMAAPPMVSAYDPLRNSRIPARLLSRSGDTAIFEITATDYPRLLTLEYPG